MKETSSEARLSDYLEGHFGIGVPENVLLIALTHSSYKSVNPGCADNEKFEFLGDAVLDLIVAEEVLGRFPDEAEGVLSELRAYLVSADMLCDVSAELGFPDLCYASTGARELGLSRKLVSSLYEAVLGAIYISKGLEPSRRFVSHTLFGRLDTVNLKDISINPKGQLQEYLASINEAPPIYETLSQAGPDNSPMFRVLLVAAGQEYRGEGGSIKNAEAHAARKALAVLRMNDPS